MNMYINLNNNSIVRREKTNRHSTENKNLDKYVIFIIKIIIGVIFRAYFNITRFLFFVYLIL